MRGEAVAKRQDAYSALGPQFRSWVVPQGVAEDRIARANIPSTYYIHARARNPRC